MPSRISIGPENGPYVAINEENGNLQLEDNSGNVVAEWDETNAQWDFANNTLNNVDALNSNSVNTDKTTSKILNTDWVVDVGDFDTVQEALDYADNNGKEIVVLPPGSYEESINIPARICLFGSLGRGRRAEISPTSADTADYAVTLNNRSTLFGVNPDPDSGGPDSVLVRANEAIVENCTIRGDDSSQRLIRLEGANSCSITGNYMIAGDIELDSDSDQNSIIGNQLATITDNGSGNEVVGNT